MRPGPANALPFDDREDFEVADRGLVGSVDTAVFRSDDGAPVWDNDSCAPDTYEQLA